MTISKFLLVFLLLFSLAPITEAQTQKTGSILISNNFVLKNKDDENVGATINFSLVKDGVPVSAASLTSNQLNNQSTEWRNIPAGVYELHCETMRFGTIIKRIGIVAGNRYVFDITDMPGNGKETIQGGNPSLFDLQKQIQGLMAQIAALKSRLAEVEKPKQ